MSFRKTTFLLVCSTLFALTTAMGQDKPANIFELDGNTFLQAPINCDWNALNAGKSADSTTPTTPCSYLATGPGAYSFLQGSASPANFTTGGSKDGQDIPNWAWTETSTPD